MPHLNFGIFRVRTGIMIARSSSLWASRHNHVSLSNKAEKENVISVNVSDQVHNYPRMIVNILARIKSAQVCEENQSAILAFHNHIICEGLSLARQTKYLETL